MRTFALINMKGGVGKTTTAVNLAYSLAVEHRLRVLLVDADGQANATQQMLPRGEYDGLAALLSGENGYYVDLIERTDIPRLDVLPASNELWSVDISSVTRDAEYAFGALRDLREAIEEDDSYDVMIMDCPPNFSTACIAAIQAGGCVIIPVLADAFSAEGMWSLVDQITSVKRVNPNVRIGGILINQWHKSDVVLDAEQYIREESPVPVYETVIRRTDKVIESTWCREPVMSWSPFCGAARDCRAFARERMEKEDMVDGQV
jgi:chromosome partitioning protein